MSVLPKPLERHIHNHLILWRITAFFTIFSLDLDHSTRVTPLSALCDHVAAVDRSEIVGVVFLHFKKALIWIIDLAAKIEGIFE